MGSLKEQKEAAEYLKSWDFWFFLYSATPYSATRTHKLASLKGVVGEARRGKLGDEEVEELAFGFPREEQILQSAFILCICRRKQGKFYSFIDIATMLVSL